MAIEENIIDGLMADIVGVSSKDDIEKDTLQTTIQNILHDYNLSTDLSFVEKIAAINFGKTEQGKSDKESIGDVPQELKDAAFLPVNTIADIALKQDIDTVITQIPEWYTAIQVMRDTICETDIVTGRLARNITFDETKVSDDVHEKGSIIGKIEECEERLELHQLIKNHMVTGTIEYGEDAMYCIPYAKVFQDLYEYRLSQHGKQQMSGGGMFDTTTLLQGFGYHEQAIETSLKDEIISEMVKERIANEKIITDSTPKGDYKRSTRGASVIAEQSICVFTEQEIQELYPRYHNPNITDEMDKDEKEKITQYQQEADAQIDEVLNMLASNITFVKGDIALPVLEESAHDLKAVYETKYREKAQETVDETTGKILYEGFVKHVDNLFEQVMQEADPGTLMPQFEKVKGIYLKPLPATKLIPIRIDRCVVGYYYYSDGTRPEQAGERKNSGLTGYTLRSPSVGYDTFSPDRLLCQKLATKIINNFDLKFMRDNTALHEQIVAILQSHNFQNSMMRFVYIPAEYVVFSAINKDGAGKGHSMLEPGLVTARMYMFLKLYSLLYQINNSQIRVYNLRTSGLDQNYRKFIQETMRKFSARRITANDIFNYRSSMTKVSGGSEMVMYLGPGDKEPITVNTIPAAEAPIATEFLDKLKDEAIHSLVVPAAAIQTAMTEMEFAKEVELTNTRMNSASASYKIELNPSVTTLYRRVLRYETDIDPSVLATLKFSFRMNYAKELSVTSDMITNFFAVRDMAVQTFLSTEEQKPDSDNAPEGLQNTLVREYSKLLIREYLPTIDPDRLEELAELARRKANKKELESRSMDSHNLLADKAEEDDDNIDI